MYSLLIFGQEVWPDKSRILPEELREIPEAIFIMHSPNPNYPEPTTKKDKTKFQYIWKHSTSVISPEKDLEIVKAGSFIWYSEKGWFRNVNFDKRDFIKRFNCPKGLIQAGKKYTYKKNYRFGDQLYGGDALWYVIAKDSEGKLFKGLSIIETEATLLTTK